MIKLTRNLPTAELEAKVAERVNRFNQLLDEGNEPTNALLSAYRNPEVKEHLIAEANGKCIYCESKITHVYFGDIEHLKPKAIFPRERLDLSNLALACAKCNNAKSDYWDQHLPLLNPYEDDPDDHLIALGYLIARRPGKDRARITIEQLQLNRQALLERRKERIELLLPLADQFACAPEGPLKQLLKQELLRQAENNAEYAMVVRAFLKAACNLELDDNLIGFEIPVAEIAVK